MIVLKREFKSLTEEEKKGRRNWRECSIEDGSEIVAGVLSGKSFKGVGIEVLEKSFMNVRE